MEQKVYKSGSSLVVVVPAQFVEMVGIQKGDRVKVRADPNKSMVSYKFSATKQLSFSANFMRKKGKKGKKRKK